MRIFAAILTFILAQASTLTTEQRRETVRAMEKALIEGYIDESVGRRVAEGLEKRVVTGEFDTQPDATTLATALERALHAEHEDKHFLVWHGPLGELVKRAPGLSGPSVGRTEIMPSGIAYIEIRNFVGGEFDMAMAAAKDASTIVFDVRETPGGDRAPVLYLLSYLFSTPTVVWQSTSRAAPALAPVSTLQDIHGDKRPTVRVFVLISGHTVSAAEAFVFALKLTHRAVLVGERTGGAGHFVRFTPLPHGFFMLVPTGMSVDPATGKGFEGDGVAPDVETPAGRALDVALKLARSQ